MTPIETRLEELKEICEDNDMSKPFSKLIKLETALPQLIEALEVAVAKLTKITNLECGNCNRGPEYSNEEATLALREIQKILEEK